MSHARTPIEAIRDAQPTIETEPAGPPVSFGRLRDLADDLRGNGPSRRYPQAVVEPILDTQSTEIAYQLVLDSVPAQLVVCHRLEECPSHTVVEIVTSHGEEVSRAYALPTLSEASYHLLYRIVDALETTTPLELQAVEECVLEVLQTTVPAEFQPAVKELLGDLA